MNELKTLDCFTICRLQTKSNRKKKKKKKGKPRQQDLLDQSIHTHEPMTIANLLGQIVIANLLFIKITFGLKFFNAPIYRR